MSSPWDTGAPEAPDDGAAGEAGGWPEVDGGEERARELAGAGEAAEAGDHVGAGARVDDEAGAFDEAGAGELADGADAVDGEVLDAAEAALDAVAAALERLADGTYGTCGTCGRALEDDVLAVDPTADRCPEHLPWPRASVTQ